MKFTFKRLQENMLNEDIAAVRKMYPKLTDGEFEYIVKRFDPTYKAGSDSVGKYGKWLLNLANKGDFEVTGDEEQVAEFVSLLVDFEKKKNSLENKDIGQFKSIDQLRAKLQDTQAPELTARQKERQMRKAYKDAELIWQDDEWAVWYPQNWDAACTLGKGTSWCTADSRNPRYYVEYVYGFQGVDIIPLNELNRLIYDQDSLMDFVEILRDEVLEDVPRDIIGDEETPIEESISNLQRFIAQKYSKDCAIIWDDSIFLVNPHDNLPYSQCEYPLFIFINKKDNSEKYQLYVSYVYDSLPNVDEWSFANKNDTMLDFSDFAWNDKSFADFAEQILGVPPQDYLPSTPPWADEGDDGEEFKWSLEYYNKETGVIREETVHGTEHYIDAYMDKLRAEGWTMTKCEQL